MGTLDGRLIALDEQTGMPVWTVATTDNAKQYSITGAPRIAKGLVIIGNAGAENGVRGYVSAYDAETGKMAWRTYTVPGDPSKGFESKAMETAAKTWTGEWWKTGGGGTPWEGIVYDPALDLLYFGTGNATAWYRALRGGGDSLYTASILAVHASNGELAWYFQTTPGDNWDYDATQPLMQADLNIGGRARKVIMQANKNGFFYVLDRETGEFISGTPFVSGVTWATGLDPKTGRPIESPGVAGLEARDRFAQPGRRAQLEPDGVQSRDRAGLSAGESRARSSCMRPIRNGSTIPTATIWASMGCTMVRSTRSWVACRPRPENWWRGIRWRRRRPGARSIRRSKAAAFSPPAATWYFRDARTASWPPIAPPTASNCGPSMRAPESWRRR